MCNVSYVSRQASSGSAGQASAATLSILGEGIVGIALLCTIDSCVKLTKNEGLFGGGPELLHSGESRPGERFRSAPATTHDVPLPDETETSPRLNGDTERAPFQPMRAP